MNIRMLQHCSCPILDILTKLVEYNINTVVKYSIRTVSKQNMYYSTTQRESLLISLQKSL